jgi:iron complex outermembrane receptor protein
VTNPPDTLYEFYSSKILTDLGVSYKPKDWLRITAGLNNAFDIYPDRLKYQRISSGGITLYSQGSSPFGLNGGYYFLGMVFSW